MLRITFKQRSFVIFMDMVPTAIDSSNTSETECHHRFIMDWIDIDPDRSQVIWYCECCYAIPSEEQIKETNKVK